MDNSIKKNYTKSLYSTSIKLFDFYFSASKREFGFGKCNNYSYKITFKAVDSSGKVIPGARIDGMTASSSGKVSKFYSVGAHSIKVSANGYKTKIFSFGVINKAFSKNIVLTKGSSSAVENETDSTYSAGKNYKASTSGGSGYYSSQAAQKYVEPIEQGIHLPVGIIQTQVYMRIWILRHVIFRKHIP